MYITIIILIIFRREEIEDDFANKSEQNVYSGRLRRRSVEIGNDISTQFRPRRYSFRKSISSFEGYFNNFIDDNEIKDSKNVDFDLFDDKDYILSFDKAFIDSCDRRTKSRKVSLDDDLSFNYQMERK